MKGSRPLYIRGYCRSGSTGFPAVARYAAIAFSLFVLLISVPQQANAQGVFGFFTDNFVYMPQLIGEARMGPVMMKVIQGQDEYRMYDDAMFFDVFVKAGLGRLSGRFIYEPRNFLGLRLINGLEYHTRFEFEGVRLGIGADLIRRQALFAGISLDYDIYPPKLSGSFDKDTGREVDVITPKTPMSLGAYATYNAPMNIMGMTPTVDASFRTSIMGAHLQDYRVAGGLQLPTTVLGTMAVRAGYQNTALQFHKDVSVTKREVNIGYAGWFIELAYYY